MKISKVTKFKMSFYFLVVVIALFFTGTISAALSSSITQDTTFTIEYSPYSVDGDIYITSGVTVKIDPGVTFQFKANTDVVGSGDYTDRSEIIVYGTLIAEGTPDNIITFKSYYGSNVAGEWGQIKIDLQGKLFIQYSSIKNSKNGVYIYNSAPMEIHIENGTFQNIEFNAIKITSSNITKSYICSNNFEVVGQAVYSLMSNTYCSNNSIMNSTNGIEVSDCSIVTLNRLTNLSGWGSRINGDYSTIMNNTYQDINGSGIDRFGSNCFVINNVFENIDNKCIDVGNCDNNKFYGNYFWGNGSGYGIYHNTSSNDNIMTNNIISGFLSGVFFDNAENKNNLVYNNTIYSNSCGIRQANNYFDPGYDGNNTCYTRNNLVINNSDFGLYSYYRDDGSHSVFSNRIYSDFDNVWNNGSNYSHVNIGDHNISVNPLFTNPDIKDFTLHEGSPCLVMGENGSQMGAYGGFRQYNHSPVFDFVSLNGNDLFADQSVDIQWTATDPDTDDVYIYLFWDTDTDTADMTGIDLNLSNTGSYTWNTSRMVPGSYYIHGIVYDYKLGRVSKYSTSRIIISHDSNNETTPTNLTAYPSNQSVSLSWEAPQSGTIDHYVIYQSTVSGFNPTVSDSIGKSISISFNVSGLNNGTTYYYRVAARKTDGNLTGFSNSISVTPQAVTVQVGSESSAPGAGVSIPVSVTDVTGIGVISYQFKITFNTGFLNLGSVTTTDCITSGWSAPSVNIGDSTVIVWHSGATHLTGSGNLVNLEFTVNLSASPGDSTEIRISDVLVNEGDPGFNYFNGWYSVYPAFTISGTAQYYMGSHLLEGVSISLSGAQSANTTTNSLGEFTLPSVQGGWIYEVAASNTGILAQSISAYDAALILRHIALLDTLESNQLIAADVSGDGTASSTDASNICQWGVELIDEFPGGASWYMTPEVISIDPLTQDTSTINFMGIAYGDVSGNYDCGLGKSTGYPFVLNESRPVYVNEPDEYRIDIEKSEEIIDGSECVVYYLNINTTNGILAFTFKFDLSGGVSDNLEFIPSSEFQNHLTISNYVDNQLIITSAGIYPSNEKCSNIGRIILDISSPIPWGELTLSYAEINEEVVFPTSTTDVNDAEISIPREFNLYQNYPNPFNRSTCIKYDIPKTTRIDVLIYDLQGRLVKTIFVNKTVPPGCYSVIWDCLNDSGNAIHSGLYIYQIKCNEYIDSKKLLYLK